MNNRDFLNGRMERFLRCRLAEESLNKEKLFRPSLTISRQCGVGLENIANHLVEYLDEADESADHGWAYFDQALVGKVIEDHKLSVSVEPYLVENTKFPVVEALEELLNLHPSDWSLFNYSADTIRKLCSLGNSIVVGRAGNFVTADLKNVFHIRLVGSEAFRIKRAESIYVVAPEVAKQLVRETDRGRERFVKRYVDADSSSTDFYHLVINTDNLSPELLVRIIADTVLEWAHDTVVRSSRDMDLPVP